MTNFFKSDQFSCKVQAHMFPENFKIAESYKKYSETYFRCQPLQKILKNFLFNNFYLEAYYNHLKKFQFLREVSNSIGNRNFYNMIIKIENKNIVYSVRAYTEFSKSKIWLEIIEKKIANGTNLH